jgi:hypothetical protein
VLKTPFYRPSPIGEASGYGLLRLASRLRDETIPPLNFSAEEMDVLLALAAPIDYRQRDQFLREVAAELEAGIASGALSSDPANFHPGGVYFNWTEEAKRRAGEKARA